MIEATCYLLEKNGDLDSSIDINILVFLLIIEFNQYILKL